MKLDAATFFSFFLIFVRCSAFCMSAPMFGSTTIPVRIRILLSGALAFALTFFLKDHAGPVPDDLVELSLSVGNEALSGLLLGAFFGLIMQAATMAGAFADLQLGLNMGQALNPISGETVSVIGQFKTMLCLAVFLSVDAHHVMLTSLVQSYDSMPTLSSALLPSLTQNVVDLIAKLTLLGLQMAMPVVAVSLIVDAGLALVNKAVPQMQIFLVGMPLKSGIGMVTLSLALPALTAGVQAGVEHVTAHLPSVAR